jgi:hypothetical protein
VFKPIFWQKLGSGKILQTNFLYTLSKTEFCNQTFFTHYLKQNFATTLSLHTIENRILQPHFLYTQQYPKTEFWNQTFFTHYRKQNFATTLSLHTIENRILQPNFLYTLSKTEFCNHTFFTHYWKQNFATTLSLRTLDELKKFQLIVFEKKR